MGTNRCDPRLKVGGLYERFDGVLREVVEIRPDCRYGSAWAIVYKGWIVDKVVETGESDSKAFLEFTRRIVAG